LTWSDLTQQVARGSTAPRRASQSASGSRGGFELRRAVFWNGVFQSFIENVLMRLAERAAIALRGGSREPGAGSREKTTLVPLRHRPARARWLRVLPCADGWHAVGRC